MDSEGVQFTLAVAGLGFWLAFTQTARHLTVNQVARLLSLLVLPIAIAGIWRIALTMQWWTILVFVVVAVTVGVINGLVLRSMGKIALYNIQMITGLIGVALIAISWVPIPR